MTLAEIGKALYGLQWKTPLALELGTSDRTVYRWEVGAVEPPADLAERLLEVIRKRERALMEARHKLVQHGLRP